MRKVEVGSQVRDSEQRPLALSSLGNKSYDNYGAVLSCVAPQREEVNPGISA